MSGRPRKQQSTKPAKSLEQRLWDAADALRGNQEPSEYKHVVLGLVFLKYISDRFEARRQRDRGLAERPELRRLHPERGPARSSSSRTATSTRSHNVFWVPAEARWSYIQDRAKLPEIGQVIDNAMDLIEKENRIDQGRPAAQLRPRGSRQGPARPARRPDRLDRLHRDGRPRQRRRARPRLRVLPRPVRRQGDRQGRGRVLHAALGRQDAGRDARAVPRAASTTRPAARAACSSSRPSS